MTRLKLKTITNQTIPNTWYNVKIEGSCADPNLRKELWPHRKQANQPHAQAGNGQYQFDQVTL